MLLSLFLGVAVIAQSAPAPLPTITLAACQDPAERRAFLDARPDKMAPFVAMKEQSDAQEAKMTLLLDRLGTRAKLSAEQKGAVAAGMVDTPEFKAALAEGMELVTTLLTSLSGVTASKDDLSECRTLVGIMALLPAIKANADRQWIAMRGVVEGEAHQAGVSLAD